MKAVSMLLTMLLAMSLSACNPDTEESAYTPPAADPGENPDNPSQVALRMTLTIGANVFSATLADNAAAKAFGAMLPMSIGMSELNGNEKYYYLPRGLPVSVSYPETVRSGDILLFGSDCLVLFYKTFPTSYGYTTIGRVDDPSGLEAAVGSGGVSVKFELNND